MQNQGGWFAQTEEATAEAEMTTITDDDKAALMQYFLNLEQNRAITAFAKNAFDSGYNKAIDDGRTEVLKTIQAQAYLAGYLQSEFDVESKVNVSLDGADATKQDLKTHVADTAKPGAVRG